MKKHKELHIRVDSQNLSDFINDLSSALPEDWQRDTESEARSLNATGRLFAYFRCDASELRRSSMVAMYKKGPNTIYVSNVVPLDQGGPLSCEEYNTVLMDFHDRVLRNLNTRFPVTVIASGDSK